MSAPTPPIVKVLLPTPSKSLPLKPVGACTHEIETKDPLSARLTPEQANPQDLVPLVTSVEEI